MDTVGMFIFAVSLLAVCLICISVFGKKLSDKIVTKKKAETEAKRRALVEEQRDALSRAKREERLERLALRNR